SSRRRHTRSKRDWSSDVCSSDLDEKAVADRKALHFAQIGHDDIVQTEAVALQKISKLVLVMLDPLDARPHLRILQDLFDRLRLQIGRASCRERVYISVDSGYRKL